MKKRTFVTVLAVIAIVLAISVQSTAQDYTASLAQMPVYAESLEKGVLVDLVKAMEVETGKKIKLIVVPFARSMNNVKTGAADFHMPLIKVPHIPDSELDYDNSTVTIFHVNFVLFTNKEKPLDKEKLKEYKLETDRAHTQYFDFEIAPSSTIEGSLMKVNTGRIDGFVFADFASDPIIKSKKLTNIKRELYRIYDVKIILPKGGKGGKVDDFLTETVKKMKEKGTYQKIMDKIDTPYDNWQP